MLLPKNTDKATTLTGAVTAASGIIAASMGIDPDLFAVIPPPYNMYVMLGLIAIMGISHVIQAIMTNKHTVNVTSDSQQSFPPLVK